MAALERRFPGNYRKKVTVNSPTRTVERARTIGENYYSLLAMEPAKRVAKLLDFSFREVFLMFGADQLFGNFV